MDTLKTQESFILISYTKIYVMKCLPIKSTYPENMCSREGESEVDER